MITRCRTPITPITSYQANKQMFKLTMGTKSETKKKLKVKLKIKTKKKKRLKS